jgi:hypothetical protein
MRNLVPEFERRLHRRAEPSHPCELVIGAHRHAGTILEISRGGGYVRTEAQLPAGQRVRVRFADQEREAVVIHSRGVARSLRRFLQGGVGLRWVEAKAS